MESLDVSRFSGLIKQFVSRYITLDDAMFGKAEPLLKVARISKGTTFCDEGQPFGDLGFVAQGIFKAYFTSNDGAVKIRSFSFEGEHVGPYGSILLGRPSSVTIEALDDSVVILIKYTDLQKLYNLDPRWERFGRLIAEDHYRWWELREFQLLCGDAEGRYKAAYAMLGANAERLQQKDLAHFIGISPESLSRLKKRVTLKP